MALKDEWTWTLKNRLGEILKERGMTQAELAELTGLRANTISEIVKNQRDVVNRKHIGAIAQALGIEEISVILYFDRAGE
jgi:transcriptional regulator with XRE-family HTH domain